MRKRIYIAGPISKGPLVANVNQATEAFVTLAKAGFAPFCPHWSVYAKPCERFDDTANWIFDDAKCRAVGTIEGNPLMTHADWMGIDLAWIRVSDAVLRLPGESTGSDLEVQEAYKYGIPVFHHIEALIEWGLRPSTAVPPKPAPLRPDQYARGYGPNLVETSCYECGITFQQTRQNEIYCPECEKIPMVMRNHNGKP